MVKTEKVAEAIFNLKEEGFTSDEILDIILKALEEATPAETTHEELSSFDVRITELFKQLGVPAHVKGYEYLRYAVKSLLESDEKMSLTKEIYPLVAKHYKSTASRVERAMRHAVEISWDRGDYEVRNRIFGYSVNPEKGKATNGEFIYAVVDEMKLRMKTI